MAETRLCDTQSMEVALALLADAANTTRDGKLNVLGVFDAIYAPKFPSAHPSMVLVLRLEALADDWDRKHELDVRFIDEDGAQLLKIDARVLVPPGGDSGRPRRFTHPIQINGLSFKKPGNFAFEIRVNGELATTLPLSILEAKRTSGGAQV